MLVLRTLLVYLITLAIKTCNGELNTTKKCAEGWQGKDCEFCAGKIRWRKMKSTITFHISSQLDSYYAIIHRLLSECLLILHHCVFKCDLNWRKSEFLFQFWIEFSGPFFARVHHFPVVSNQIFLLLFTYTHYRLTEPSGFIHDGLGNYSIGVKCSWLIDARDPLHPLSSIKNLTDSKKKPKRIRLHLEEFATECSWDHLYIYDGDSVQSPLLAVFR